MKQNNNDDSFCNVSEKDSDECPGESQINSQKFSKYLGHSYLAKYHPPSKMPLKTSSNVCLQKPCFPLSKPTSFSSPISPRNAEQGDQKIIIKEQGQLQSQTESEEIKSTHLNIYPDTQNKAIVFPSIHEAVFKAEYGIIKKGLKDLHYTQKDFEIEDSRGNTPLFLAVKLCLPREENIRRYKTINLLLKSGANPLHKTKDGWSLLDIAVSIKNEQILKMIYEYVRITKLKTWKRKREDIFNNLITIPDFYLEIQWDFRSSIIPFLSYFTPSDTYKIWKMGSSLRLDFSFLGFNENKAVNSDTSILMREGYLINDAYKKMDFLVLDKANKVLVNPLQTPEEDEREQVIKELAESQPMQGDITIEDFTWTPASTFFGNPKTKEIHGRISQKYRLNLDTVVNTKAIENNGIASNYEEYLNSSENTITKHKEGPEKAKKKIDCGIWTSKDFPLNFSQVMTVIRTLAKNNNNFKKLKEYLSDTKIQSIISDNGFPVRIQIPMGYTIYAVVTFTVYKNLHPEYENYQEIFSVPPNYSLIKRKDAFPCIGKKKGIIIANLNI